MRILQTSLTGDDKQPSSTIHRAYAQQAECWSRRNSCYENVFTFVPCAFNDFSFDLFMNSKSCFAYSVFFPVSFRWASKSDGIYAIFRISHSELRFKCCWCFGGFSPKQQRYSQIPLLVWFARILTPSMENLSRNHNKSEIVFVCRIIAHTFPQWIANQPESRNKFCLLELSVTKTEKSKCKWKRKFAFWLFHNF